MDFITDKQTLEDLNLLGKYRRNSVFHLFDQTETKEGEKVLEQMFMHPLTDADAINRRSAVFRFFQQAMLSYPIPKALQQAIHSYLSVPAFRHRGMAFLNVCWKKVTRRALMNKQYELIVQGMKDTVEWLCLIRDFHKQLVNLPGNDAYFPVLQEIKECLYSSQLTELIDRQALSSLSFGQIVRYDYLLRSRCRDVIQRLIEILALTDVYISVASVAMKKKWGFAHAYALEKEHFIEIKDLVHPCLKEGVPNSLRIDGQQNVIFLTGANMAGKSTLMKAFSVAVYLAHMGFPVPASDMKFVVREGLFTSINLPDDIRLGYSHFYAEVMRVKQVAQEVSRKKNLLVVFDELFKGTNVKDAYDATLAVTEAFAAYHNCDFIISTHILEVGEALNKCCPHIQFKTIRTVMEGNKARYTYKLESGITHDHHGMMIIRNEHILDILDAGKQQGQ